MRTNNGLVLLFAIGMGGIAALLARNWLVSHSRTSATAATTGTIVVASKPLKFGVVLAADDLTEVPWAATAIPDGAFATKGDLLKSGQRVVLSAIERSEPVLRSKISGPGERAALSTLLPVGKRAVTVRVDDVRGVAGFILPGDFVDVVLIGEDGSQRRENYSEILVQNLKVLAVDQLASERPEQPTVPKAVTLEVTPEQAQKILLATNIGKLSLTLRRPADAAVARSQRVTERDLGPHVAKVTEPVRVVAPPPPKPVAKPPVQPSNRVKVFIIRNMKREEYTVRTEK